MVNDTPQWVFGYGSLIWRPDFEFIEAVPAALSGFARRFWQGSHDHRGLPEHPGRVVTLVSAPGETCVGMAYLIKPEIVQHTFERLDYREKNGYERWRHPLTLQCGRSVDSLVYVAPKHNPAYLGHADANIIVHQILRSEGPSGSNISYLLELATALRRLNACDKHVFELESLARSIMNKGSPCENFIQ